MGPDAPLSDADRVPQAKTLRDVLYARGTRSSMSEDEWCNLIRSIAAGDQLALHSLYELTHRIVFTLMVRITQSREASEELTLDVLHDVWRKASTYDRANGSVMGWIMNQARSRAIDRVRYEQRRKRVNNETNGPVVSINTDDPQNAFHLKEQSLLLKEALDRLNPKEREAIELAFFSELTYQEVAVRLNEPPGTVKSRIRSALSKLRDVLIQALENITL
jgi:RNA polymerase sigma-70 factor, ECF subfamily